MRSNLFKRNSIIIVISTLEKLFTLWSWDIGKSTRAKYWKRLGYYEARVLISYYVFSQENQKAGHRSQLAGDGRYDSRGNISEFAKIQ